ncbi:MAG: hypothetical protein P8Y18_02065 [Candidatus Bathyarchaeota archaeon]
MEKSSFGILLLVVGLVVHSLGVFFLAIEYDQNRFEPTWEELTINNIEFNGISGSENNSVILFLENKNRRTNVIAKEVNILGVSFNQTFSVKPEENNYPTRSQGQITLANVGWVEGIEYEIRIISSNGSVCGAITKTA